MANIKSTCMERRKKISPTWSRRERRVSWLSKPRWSLWFLFAYYTKATITSDILFNFIWTEKFWNVWNFPDITGRSDRWYYAFRGVHRPAFFACSTTTEGMCRTVQCEGRRSQVHTNPGQTFGTGEFFSFMLEILIIYPSRKPSEVMKPRDSSLIIWNISQEVLKAIIVSEIWPLVRCDHREHRLRTQFPTTQNYRQEIGNRASMGSGYLVIQTK